jgi:hypothetical protein
MRSNTQKEELNEITWNTVTNYLKERYDIPIPMYSSDSCVLVIKPGASVELQLRTGDAFQTDFNRFPQLTRFHYRNVTTKNYRYLGIVCDYTNFDEVVLKFFNSIALNFVAKQASADSSILHAYEQWKQMLAQSRMPDEITLIGLWGELFIIDLLLENKSIDAMYLMQNWTGPLGAANDFSFGNSCIEIKTTTKQSDIVEISSIDQLDAEQAWIILLRALHAPVNSGGITITELVDSIRLTLDAAALEIFQKRIDVLLPLSDLSKLNSFSLKSDDIPVAVQIDDTYPLLTRRRVSKMLSGSSLAMLINVKYTLNLTDKLSTGTSDISGLFRDIALKGESHEQN